MLFRSPMKDTVTLYANSGSARIANSLNFVNTASINVSVTGGSTGNANVSFSYNPSGLYTIWVPATSMFSTNTSGANAAWSESTTNKINIKTFDFAKSSQRFTQFQIRMPKAWNKGTIQFEPAWTANTGTVANTVSWNVAAVSIGDGLALDTAFGTPRTSTDSLQNLNLVHIGPQPATPITVGGTPAAGDIVFFQVSRDVNSDTLETHAKLLGVTLFININAKDDT